MSVTVSACENSAQPCGATRSPPSSPTTAIHLPLVRSFYPACLSICQNTARATFAGLACQGEKYVRSTYFTSESTTTSEQLKIATRDFSKTAGLKNTYF